MKRRVLVLGLAMLLGATFSLQAQDDLARELPRIPPREPAEALKSFKLHPGFRLEAVATEPLVSSPVSVCYDADGLLYVVQMHGYPYTEDKPSGAVVRLEDRDGDGRFDAKTVFLDGLMWPTGVVPYDGGVFVAVAPEIIYAKDVDGDGVADVRKVVFSGFGTGNVQGLVNGLLWGPDGWIYGSAERSATSPAPNSARSRFAAATSGSGLTARRSSRSPAAARTATASTTGGTASSATTATTSARSSCRRTTSSAIRRTSPPG